MKRGRRALSGERLARRPLRTTRLFHENRRAAQGAHSPPKPRAPILSGDYF
jgi:hypothetical protein